MHIYDVAIIGAGASGLMTILQLQSLGIKNIVVFDGNERVGRKLAATGNGQGNISNMHLGVENYFSSNLPVVHSVLQNFTVQNLIDYFKNLGLYLQADKVGRIYPIAKQASTITDILRFSIAKSTAVYTNMRVQDILQNKYFTIKTQQEEFYSKILVLATGGIAGANFGSDGFGHTIAKKFGHTLTPFTPSITRLIVAKNSLSGLKGVRLQANVALNRKGKEIVQKSGDIVFADNMVGGDSIYKISAFYQKGDSISIDFLPNLSVQEIEEFIQITQQRYPDRTLEECLKGLLHGSVVRFLLKKQDSMEIKKLLQHIKRYELCIEKPAGFDFAQVTKGGVNMQEVDTTLKSKKCKNLYFTGEILDCDGECGGYNLQWAFSSAVTVARAIAQSLQKG